jgi:hypothetical protein
VSGLPNWSQRNAASLQEQFNRVVGYIRQNGTEVTGIRKPHKGKMVDVRYWEYIFGGNAYYYYEALDCTFISAGLSQ